MNTKPASASARAADSPIYMITLRSGTRCVGTVHRTADPSHIVIAGRTVYAQEIVDICKLGTSPGVPE